ncbi:TPA: hypothetical protein EYP44_00180 [Candidatus Bathyarchaeota archaeon]|nr:hypothetical protein [Candidatus Bathyarchaeota archaeon]
MRRTNIFALAPTAEQEKVLFEVALGCAKLWNELTYRRRKAYNYQPIEWYGIRKRRSRHAVNAMIRTGHLKNRHW